MQIANFLAPCDRSTIWWKFPQYDQNCQSRLKNFLNEKFPSPDR